MDTTHHEALPAEVVYPVTKSKLVIDSMPEGPKMETKGEIVLAQQGATLQHIGKAINGPEKDEKMMMMMDSLKNSIDYSNNFKQREKIFPKEVASSNGHVPSQTKHGKKESPTNMSNGRTYVPSNPNTYYYAKNFPCSKKIREGRYNPQEEKTWSAERREQNISI